MKPLSKTLTLVLSLLTFVAACSNNPENQQIVVYVTATAPPGGIPAIVDSAPATTAMTGAIQFPTSTLTPTETSLPAFPTSTPSLTPSMSATPSASVTPRPSVTPSPSPSPSVTPTPEIPPADALPILDSNRMGIQIHPGITAEEWNVMIQHTRTLGVKWVKFQLSWRAMEPEQGVFSPEFNKLLLEIPRWSAYSERNARFLLSIVNAPDWARPAGADLTTNGPPADPQLLANFLRTLLTSFKPEDLPLIEAIEVWNEPNLAHEWNGVSMDGGTYMRYFGAAYGAIKEIAPHVIVVSAGLAPVGDGVPGSVGDRTFLRQMYNAGLARYADIKVGVHPYGWGNPPDSVCCDSTRPWADNPVFFFNDTLTQYMNIMAEYGHSSARIWVTEFGWGTYEEILPNGESMKPPPVAEFFELITPRQQAEYVIQAFKAMQEPPFGNVVEVAILWNLNFAMIGDIRANPVEQAGYGLLNAGGQPRLVYRYLERTRKTGQ